MKIVAQTGIPPPFLSRHVSLKYFSQTRCLRKQIPRVTSAILRILVFVELSERSFRSKTRFQFLNPQRFVLWKRNIICTLVIFLRSLESSIFLFPYIFYYFIPVIVWLDLNKLGWGWILLYYSFRAPDRHSFSLR